MFSYTCSKYCCYLQSPWFESIILTVRLLTVRLLRVRCNFTLKGHGVAFKGLLFPLKIIAFTASVKVPRSATQTTCKECTTAVHAIHEKALPFLVVSIFTRTNFHTFNVQVHLSDWKDISAFLKNSSHILHVSAPNEEVASFVGVWLGEKYTVLQIGEAFAPYTVKAIERQGQSVWV